MVNKWLMGACLWAQKGGFCGYLCNEAGGAGNLCAETRRSGDFFARRCVAPARAPSQPPRIIRKVVGRGRGPHFCTEVRRAGPLPRPTAQDYEQDGWVGAWACLCARRCVAPAHSPAQPPRIISKTVGWGRGPVFCTVVRRAGPRPLPATQRIGEASGRGCGPVFASGRGAGCDVRNVRRISGPPGCRFAPWC